MSEDKQKLVPELRFPEFDGEWERKTVGEVAKKIDAGWSPNCLERTALQHEWGILKTTAVTWSGYSEVANKALPKTMTPRPNLEVTAGDILITRAGPVDRVGVVAHVNASRAQLMLSDKLIRIRAKSAFDALFVATVIGQFTQQSYLRARKSGLAESQANISQKIVNGIPLPVPPLPEQQKIANFLDAVSKKIALLNERRVALEEHKRGMMQRLFSGSLRFTRPDGSAFPDWEERKLGEVTGWKSGGTPSKAVAKYWKGNIPWVSAAAMQQRVIQNTPLNISEEAAKIGSRMVPEGSILLLVRGSMLYNRIPISIATRELSFNQDVKAIWPKSGLSNIFLLYWFLANEFLLLSLVTGTGIGAGKLDTTQLQSLAIKIPHPDEQAKIADALSAMDAKIDGVADQISQMETFKKGLLQKMFV